MSMAGLTLKRLDWWLTGFCLSRVCGGLVFISYAAALPVLQREWGMSAAAGGSIASGFVFSYAVSLVICSSLADLWGPKPLYLGSMSAAAVLALAFAFLARDYWSGLILYSLLGLSLGGIYTTGVMILSHRYAIEKRGMAIGFFIASTSMGYATSLLISGIAIPLGGYRLSFLLTGLGPLLGFLLAWLVLRHVRVPVTPREIRQGFSKEVVRNKPAMTLIGSYTLHSWELLGMWAWTPAFLAHCLVINGSGGLAAAGWGSNLSALFHATGLLASFSMGMLSDRLGRARVIILMSLLSALCSFVFGWTVGLPLLLVAAIGALYAFAALGDSPVLSAALTEVVSTAYLGSALGLRSLLGFGAGSLAPLAFGAILDWLTPAAAGGQYQGWGWAYMVLGLGGLGAAWVAWRFSKLKRIAS